MIVANELPAKPVSRFKTRIRELHIEMKPVLCLLLRLCLLRAVPLLAQETKSGSLPAGPDGAQTILTRAQAVQFALEHSPLLGAARERIAGALGNLQSAKAFPPANASTGPSFGGDVGAGPLTS